MNLSSWSIKNPIPAAMIFVLLTLAGLFSFKQMKVPNFPEGRRRLDADEALQKDHNPLLAGVVTALKQFIENPRQLTISLTPAKPVPLGEIGRAGSPEAVAGLLNLQVKS